MRSFTRHIGKLEIVERLPSSRNGNPRYSLRVDGYLCRTAPDSSIGYAVTNYDGKNVMAILATHYGKLTLYQIEHELA